MKIKRLDHIVLPVSNLEASTRFYHETFDMPVLKDQSDEQTTTLRCGHQLIRLVTTDRQALKAEAAMPGCGDLCIVAGDKMDAIVNHLKSYFIDIVAGPVKKSGSEGEMEAVYIHDLDQNLIEIAVYQGK